MQHVFSYLLIHLLCFQVSIYNYQVNGCDGNTLDFSLFQGKKILIVNIATNSPRVTQLVELNQLQQRYKDSLVVIGFPCDDFGNENHNNDDILSICTQKYGTNFLLAAKGSVSGASIQPIYQWLTKASLNGTLESRVKGDFSKYIIDSQGELVAVFGGSISPLSEQVLNTLNESQN